MPLNLAQLRAKRVEAAEARLAKEGSGTGSSSLTPLGSILMLARKVSTRFVNLAGLKIILPCWQGVVVPSIFG